MNQQKKQAVHLWVTGKVQGVSYRYYTTIEAERLRVKGWVRNLPDGRVEAWLEGGPEELEIMLQWCWQGSPAAVVEAVHTQCETPQYYRQFEVRR
ncbi:MAG: acylphosphatase [Synechococcus sp.]|nr:acylphosphatase [Synechococcus sp.]